MGNSININPSDLKIIQDILKKILPPNVEVWVFGSRAKGKGRRASDLDLAIDAHRKLTKIENSQLFHAFEDSDLSYKVDIIDLNTINKSLKEIINKEKVSLSLKEGVK